MLRVSSPPGLRRFALALLAATPVAAAPATTRDRPNILWLVSEDNGPYLGCYGDPLARTPTLDRLARDGVLYERCFAQPVCAPSRFALITGLHPASCGPAEHMRARGRIPPQVRGFPAFLRDHGYYATNNDKTDYNAPIDLGAAWDQSSRTAHWRNRGAPGQPFFSVFNHFITHESCLFPEHDVPLGFAPTDPARVRVPPYQPDTPEIRADWARYYDHLRRMDEQVGARLQELAAAGLAEDTIVFYYSDNGGVLPRSKRFLQRSGIHVPLIVYFPPKWRHLAPAAPGTRIQDPVSFVDFAPTVLSLAGVPIPAYMPGRAFAGPARAAPNAYVFVTRDRMDERYDTIRAVADARWLYVHNFRPDLPYVQPLEYMFRARGYQSWARLAAAGRLTAATAQFWGEKPTEELYDLVADPDNVTNLADSSDHRAILERLRGALRSHVVEIADNGFLPEGSALEGWTDPSAPAPWPVERVFELACLAAERNPAHLPQLIQGLTDPSEPIRWWAAQGCTMLGEHATPAVPALRSALTDSSAAVAVAAAEALARLGEPAPALAVLERVLRDTHAPWAGLQAAAVLDRLGPAARPALPVMRNVLQRPILADPNFGPEANPFEYQRQLLRHAVGVLEPSA